MDKKEREIILKIKGHIVKVLKYAAKYSTLKNFQQDEMCVEAVVFNLMQIGELARHSLSDELKSQTPQIPWKQIYGLRNRIVHGYDQVNLNIVWDTIQEDLPVLMNSLNQLLKNE